MEKKYFFLLFLIGNVALAQIPPVIQWEKNFGGSAWETAHIIRPTNDSGYILAGHAFSNDGDVSQNNGGMDVWVVKLDYFGSLVWKKTYGGSNDDDAHDIHQTTDGGYIVVGRTESSDGDVGVNKGYDDVWVIKLDALGNLVWEKTYGGSGWDHAIAVQQISGGYIVAGHTNSIDGDVGGGARGVYGC